MKDNYEELLKEQIMHNLSLNNPVTLNEIVKKLVSEHAEDVKEISQAYFIVNREILGDAVSN